MSGRTHSDATKKQISDTAKQSDNSGRFKTGENNPNYGKKSKPRPVGSGKPSQQIEVTDIVNNTTILYNSINEAARALNINKSSIQTNLKSNSNKPYKNIYMFAYKK